jgi:hypothetical protein
LRKGDFVKAKAYLPILLFVHASAVSLFGQVNYCAPGTGIFSTKLVCELPESAAYLSPFGSKSTNTLNDNFINTANRITSSIDAAIGVQLTQLPIPGATVGVVSLTQKGSDIGVPFENLGPILSDRPDMVGKGHLFMGFSYQHFNFNAVDGLDLNTLPFAFSVAVPGAGQFYSADTNKIGLQLDQYVGVATYGLTKSTDVAVIVPFNSATLSIRSSNFQEYFSLGSGYTGNLGPSGPVNTPGSADGIGDVTVSVKQSLNGGKGERLAIAAGGSYRFSTGDALNYLGSGAWGVNAYGLFEYRARLAPHLKLNYQWNGVSELMNLTAPGTNRLPGGLQYDAGADFKIVRSVTVAADILGSQVIDAPSVVANTISLPGASGSIPTSLSGLSSSTNTYSTINVSAGLKWSPLPHFLVYGNVTMQTNNVGLRSDPVPLFGIAYNLKARR